MTTTLTATPDPAAFDIHAQPTWIALGIGKLRHNYPGLQVISVERVPGEEPDLDQAYAFFVCDGFKFGACIVKWDMRPIYIDEVIS